MPRLEKARRSVVDTLRFHRRFIVLLVLFICGGLAHQATLPVMEAFDESLHYNYTTWLRTHSSLPDRTLVPSNKLGQESSQPPLTYWVNAMVSNLLNVPLSDLDSYGALLDARNIWATPPDPWRHRDNLNAYYHGPNEELLGHPEIVAGVRTARLVSLCFGILAVIGAYGAAREVFRRESWALVATAIFAFTPQMLAISAGVSNDVGSTAFATLTLWQALRLLRLGTSPFRLIVFGGLLALAGLAKVNALLIGPGVGLALLLDWRNRRLSINQLVINCLIAGTAFVLLFGPWVVYGYVNFHSPLGLEAHSIFENSSIAPPTLQTFVPALAQVYFSYWAKLARGENWMHPIEYVLFTLLVLLSLAGYVTFIVTRHYSQMSKHTAQQALIIGFVALAMIAGEIQWLIQLFAIAPKIHGRLMYPGHAAISIILAGGLYLLDGALKGRYSRFLRIYGAGLPMAAGLLMAPMVIYTLYAPPTILTHDQLPALHGSPIDFDHTIRLLGYRQTTPIVRPGTLPEITLCWEVLHTTTRPAAFAVKILDGGSEVGNRTSVFGMGHYNSSLWKTGDIFCDDIDVILTKPLHAGQTYEVIVVVLDALTQVVDWHPATPDGTPIDLPRVAQIVSPAGDMRDSVKVDWASTTISFPHLADLEGVSISGSPARGQTLHLDFLWMVMGQTPDNWSQFIHLVGPQTAVVLADKVPRAGLYPTWAWSVGEKIADQWQVEIPAALPPGDYTIQIGFYRQDTGERTPATQDGKAAADGSVTVLKFQVK
ncbi:MAG: glycosyltransferase family 39 protein [Chloroflexota bacterium]